MTLEDFIALADRKVLEEIIFPYFLKDEFKSIIFVGTAYYTKRYNDTFKDKNYWTIDKNPYNKDDGSEKHIIGRMENLDYYFDDDEFDVVFCNGVFGWGLNNRGHIESAFQACHHILRKGGILVLGWNDVPEYCPIPLSTIESLKLFTPFTFEPLGMNEYLTKTITRHTYNFYIK